LWATDAAPSLALRDDMRCAGVGRYSTRLNPHAHPVCAVGKLHVFFLQSLMFLVTANLFKVHKQLEASAKMKKYAPGPATRAGLLLLAVGLPIAMAALSLLLAADPTTHTDTAMRVRRGGVYDFYGLNRINDVRFQFTCGPFFDTIAQELAVVNAPLITAGVANILLSAMVLAQVLRMGSGGKNEAIRRLAITMLRFAGIVVTISLFGFVATILYFPEGEKFTTNFGLWTACLGSGISNEMREKLNAGVVKLTDVITSTNKTLAFNLETCGTLEAEKPSVTIINLMALAQTLPSLAFGLVFALPAIRQLKQSVQTAISRSSSRAASSASSSVVPAPLANTLAKR
jgi:hypothetical protein